MNEHWAAVEQLLAPLGYSVYRVFADQVSDQYVVLSSKAWDDAEEPAINTDASFATDLRLKAVAGTVNGVDIMLARIRGLLWPARQPAVLSVPGRDATVRYLRSEFIDVDQSTTVTGTNRHPAFGVDTYRITSDPA